MTLPDECYDEPFDDDILDTVLNEAMPGLNLTPERWRITDERSAEWAMHKVAKIRAERHTLMDEAKHYYDGIDQWHASRDKPLLGREAFFTRHLEMWMLERRAETNGEVKSIKLPSGTVSSRGGTGLDAVLEDVTAVLAFDEQHNAGLTKREPLGIRELRKIVVPGHEYACTGCGEIHYMLDGTLPTCGGCIEPSPWADLGPCVLWRIDESSPWEKVPGMRTQQRDITVSIDA